MKRRYLVKNIYSQEYYYVTKSWGKDIYNAGFFSTVEEAEKFISTERGFFAIETIYIGGY